MLQGFSVWFSSSMKLRFWQQREPLETWARSIKTATSFLFPALTALPQRAGRQVYSEGYSIRLVWKTHMVILHQTFVRKRQPGKSRGNAVRTSSLILSHPDAPPAPCLPMHMVSLLPRLIQMVLTGIGTDTGTAGLAGHINQHALCSSESCYLPEHNNLLSPANATAPELS